jgi:hypothetical protein
MGRRVASPLIGGGVGDAAGRIEVQLHPCRAGWGFARKGRRARTCAVVICLGVSTAEGLELVPEIHTHSDRLVTASGFLEVAPGLLREDAANATGEAASHSRDGRAEDPILLARSIRES